ncbi:hypothetical protein FCULG_00008367 [Fusarium culmorum]|uniref:HNH domain-containing protein n=1 Tax=Fusarium culmorum TaxID=5516 RepID=A0A2T4H0X2_FUSCU|nr:hypothetical protein FCULG_00008367 [Fusarium culmorum]
MSANENPENYALFRDCLSTTLLQPASPAPDPPKRRRRRKNSAATPAAAASTPAPNPERDAEELADFIDYLATEIFDNLPDELQTLEYRTWRDDEALQEQYSLPLTKESLSVLNLPPSVAFLLPIITSYITPLIEPPPATRATRADACELCARSWVPLSYHHLIPRFVHEKAVKRGWHRKEDLQNVAWLCGACHRFVHNFKTHEELARDYYTVDLLLEEEEVQRWATWVGKLRWKGR